MRIVTRASSPTVRNATPRARLSEYVKHRVKEERNEAFPKVKASSLDKVGLMGQAD